MRVGVRGRAQKPLTPTPLPRGEGSLLVLQLVKSPETDLLKTERTEQFHGRLIEFRCLDLTDAEILLLQVPQDVHQKKLPQPLAAHVVTDLQREDARGRGAPAPAEALHLPHLRAGGHSPG